MTPKRPDDPDPFAETPLSAEERRELLERLAAHMKPILQTASDSKRAELRGFWDELRDQETVEAFREKAEALLGRLGEPEGDGSSPQSMGLIGGFLAPGGASSSFGGWDRAVLRDLPPASPPRPSSSS